MKAPDSRPEPAAGSAAAASRPMLAAEAARAGIRVEECQERLRQGLLYCDGCKDWHPEGAFPADGRRYSGRSKSCRSAVVGAARAAPGRGQPAPPPAVWVIRRPALPGDGPGDQEWEYWRGTGGSAAARAWSPAPDSRAARFSGAAEARLALIAAFGSAGAVPAGCRLARMA